MIFGSNNAQITSDGIQPYKSTANPYEYVVTKLMGSFPKCSVSQDATFEVLQVLH